MNSPRFLDDAEYTLLRTGEIEAFNAAIRDRGEVDFSGADLRSIDFRKVDLRNLVLRDAYLRDADFRGCDLRHLDLSGASMHGAKISGAYFPINLSSGEIRMSLRHGTRIRPRANENS